MTGTSDFNDMAIEQGLPAVADVVNEALNRVKSPAPSEKASDIDAASEPPAPSDDWSDSEGLYDDDGRYSVDTLLKHFSYIYGTKHCWDGLQREQMELANLGHLVGRDRYKAWMESRNRKTVMGLKFEPGQDLGSDYINLFEGWGVEPAEGDCSLILGHIMKLCQNRQAEYEWLLNWLAYPLQNPGSKMATAVVMYGSEGPGKSITFDNVMGRIYDRHAITIGQAQLESSFTEWQSRKLFAVAEEVIARTERNHYKGMLKHLVTGQTLQIDQKHMSLREETNHLNFVFLSNSTVPLELDMGDRRYLVLYVEEVPPPEYFTELFRQIDGGGVEAFFHFLLKRDLGEFGPHSKPPSTEEKRGLIRASMTSPQYFHELWRSGELDVPYSCATASDLFKYFTRWCEENNEFKRTQRYFGQEIQRVMKPHRLEIRYPRSDSLAGQKRVYLAQPDLEKDFEGLGDHVGERCRAFREELKQLGIIHDQ